MSNRWVRLDPKVVFFACDAFTRGRNANEIAAAIRSEFNEQLHRTQVYQVIAQGRERGYFRLTPPRDALLEQRMHECFLKKRRGSAAGARRPQGAREDKVVKVVSHGFDVVLEHVAIAAADAALELIKKIRATLPPDKTGERPAVHVGFGAGGTTKLVARYLAERLRTENVPPKLVLHALSSGFNVDDPETAPVAFFSFFHGIPGIEYRGLFAPAYVKSTDWRETCRQVGIKESFAQKRALQIVITSLASSKDEDGELNRFMYAHRDLEKNTRRLLDDEEGRVGDVMYHPFSERGPIRRETEVRAVTLFDLDELVAFAADPSKAVILVAGPCGRCNRSRSDALMPLLLEPSLDVWSHLVLDDRTAIECLTQE